MDKLTTIRNLFDKKQVHTITNLDLVFVRQLNFSADIVKEIEDYNYEPLMRRMSVGYNIYYDFD